VRKTDYFTAVQEGKARVRKAVDLLSEVAGLSYPVLFLKVGKEDWTPVGEENLFSVVSGKDGTAAVVLCDSDGNSKAISAWAARSDVERLAVMLASKGISRYVGEVKLPV